MKIPDTQNSSTVRAGSGRFSRVAVLLSGGVDSSVALARLKAAGAPGLSAYYLKIWLEDDISHLGNCPWEEDLDYARRVCRLLDVPLTIVPLQLQYYERVVSYAVAELRLGRTPSPDLFCNQRIKFGAFLDYLDDDATMVATGHYAGIEIDGDIARLTRAPDRVKDQTYFLSQLPTERLHRIAFPLEDLTKPQVRHLATHYGLPTKDRKDSQGICFLGKIRYADFVRHYLGEEPGAIQEAETGREVGRHKGYWFYTVGQRQGLGLGNGPWYVTGKDTTSNTVYVSHDPLVSDRARDTFLVGNEHWIGDGHKRLGAGGGMDSDTGAGADDHGGLVDASKSLTVKLRHGPEDEPCTVRRNEDGLLEARLERPDRGVADGQFAVFYRGRYCLGGGTIEAGAVQGAAGAASPAAESPATVGRRG